MIAYFTLLGELHTLLWHYKFAEEGMTLKYKLYVEG